MHDIAYSKDAVRALKGMPRNTALRLRRKIEQFAEEPASLANNVEAIAGEPGLLRLRVGNWRLLFRLTDGTMEVRSVASRAAVYRVRR